MTKTKQDIATSLRELSEQMLDVATNMDYYGGLADWAKHGKEMVFASAVVNSWADEIERELLLWRLWHE